MLHPLAASMTVTSMPTPVSKFNWADSSLAGNRWHLNCFRCNTCGTLLDSDANLLLLGDGSLICNNCTYSCSACGNKIEDLAILTGDQAFCATCFRCRNCKRKIENLRYARTSQGIFCMSCHESLMARRRKKSRAAAAAKSKKEEQSPMLVDKSLPALPPSAVMQSAFSPDQEAAESVDTDTPTELSPRPRPGYTKNDTPSRSSSRRPPSQELPPSDNSKEGLPLPNNSYKNHRHSTISHASDVTGGDGDSFFIPLALDPSPAPTMTPRSISDTFADPVKRKESSKSDRDYFNVNSRSSARESSSTSTPHIAFQEKGRQPSTSDGPDAAKIRESIRKAQEAGSRGPSAKASPAVGPEDTKVQHASSPDPKSSGKTQSSNDKFRLGEVPKSKRAGTSRENSQSDLHSSESTRSLPATAPPLLPPRRDSANNVNRTSSPKPLLGADVTGTPRTSQDSRVRDDVDTRPSFESSHSSRTDSRSIQRKEVAPTAVKSSMSSSSGADTSPSSSTSSDTPGVTPAVNGRSISGPKLMQSPMKDELVPPTRAPARPSAPKQQMSDSYMAPRAPPAPPVMANKEPSASTPNGRPASPKLPRWSAGGDFTMDEDMARILGTDESSQSIMRRVSNAVRHGRNNSEASSLVRHGRSMSEATTRTVSSPRWPPKSPLADNENPSAQISSPLSMSSPVTEDPSTLRRQLRNSEQRVAELERQFSSETEMKNLNQKLIEKRKTVSVLDSQTEIMIRQIEVLAGYVEKAKDSKQPIDAAELEDSAIKEFVQKLERLKQSMSGAVEALYEERNNLMEEKTQIVAERDRALVEFEQLSSKNAQLADMNNDLTHQIQERFKSQSGSIDGPRPAINGLGIYTHHNKDKSSLSVHLDDASIRPSTSTTLFGSTSGSYPQSMDQDPSMIEPATVLSAPHVVNIRKGQAKKFNWKKGGQTVAKGVSKGFKGAFASSTQERAQWASQNGDNIGMPYNMTVAPVEAPTQTAAPSSLPRSGSNDVSKQGGFGLFKKSNTMPKSQSNGNLGSSLPEDPSCLFGSDLVERATFERRQIPSVVTRCIEEVELRGMDIEGIYRKTGGSGQVKLIQEGFDKMEDYDISDPDIDITAVTSVLKQYFRKLPNPLLTFDIYDRVLESTSIEDDQERCNHLRRTFNMLPPKHRDCLEFLMFHLVRVATRESENLMTPKNLAVVFAPTIMRDTSIEREMTDMHAKNNAVQFVIENSHEIFGS
ncbi:RhoGAP-domain-containing protein [Coleophoma cylindrospora]|uniref:RhoGAP-domain-containing protein n=1 Tax=Coleophoma cylindrospora TaxID=1849047 RepID=A0A3D8S0T8_9HELO|nr:RhoGAP-domain-containing protein [Coleophoma cylindrospora]